MGFILVHVGEELADYRVPVHGRGRNKVIGLREEPRTLDIGLGPLAQT